MRIAVTGHAGFIGQKLISELRGSRCERVLGIDRRKMTVPGVNGCELVEVEKDIRDPSIAQDLRANGVEVLVHLAFILNPTFDESEMASINLGGTENILACASAAGVRHVVAMSSTTAYGALPDNPVPITEDAPLRARATFPYGFQKRLFEERCWAFANRNPEIGLTVIRPCIVLGPNVNNYISANFTALPFAILVGGADIPFQFVNVDDVARALVAAATERPRGAFNVVGDGMVTMREMAAIAGKRAVSLPYGLMRRLADFMWSRRIFPGYVAQSGVLDHFRFPWVASGEKARAKLGFAARARSRDLFAALVERENARADAARREPATKRIRRAIDAARHGVTW